MLECVINISEGTHLDLIASLQGAAGSALLDTHSDAVHNRTVLTLAGNDVLDAAMAVARTAVQMIDIRQHAGVHPRLGVIDVVPFVPYEPDIPCGNAPLDGALSARRTFAEYAAQTLGLPCFLYGPERSLPDIRRAAFNGLLPDVGPKSPHPSAGACCVGARNVLVAYNLWLESTALDVARDVVRKIRSTTLRCLAFQVEDRVQISCNLIAPWHTGPMEAFDVVAAHCAIHRAELVGLLPASVLHAIPTRRWPELDLSHDVTIEARLPA